MDYLQLDKHFVALHEDELEFLVDLAVNESQRWIEVSHSTCFDRLIAWLNIRRRLSGDDDDRQRCFTCFMVFLRV